MDAKNYVDVTRRWYAENITFPLNFLLPNRMHQAQLERLRVVRGDPLLEPGEELEKEVRSGGEEVEKDVRSGGEEVDKEVRSGGEEVEVEQEEWR